MVVAGKVPTMVEPTSAAKTAPPTNPVKTTPRTTPVKAAPPTNAVKKTPRKTRVKTAPRTTPVNNWDLLAGAGAMLSAMAISFASPGLLLAWIGLAILLVVPGYLLVQSWVRTPQPWHVAAGMGLSIPLVGMLALLTAVVPGGFRPAPIVVTITVGVLALALVAWVRRSPPGLAPVAA